MGKEFWEETRLYRRLKYATLILSGGQSSRMGTDKGLMSRNDKLWVEILRDKVSKMSDVFISVGKHNHDLYSSIDAVQLILDQPFQNLAGPLKGLLSSKEVVQDYDKILIVPCDMIDLSKVRLKYLLDQKSSACYKSGEKVYPLPFAITQNDLSRLNNLENKSVFSVLKFIDVTEVEIGFLDASYRFNNYNSPSDLKKD